MITSRSYHDKTPFIKFISPCPASLSLNDLYRSLQRPLWEVQLHWWRFNLRLHRKVVGNPSHAIGEVEISHWWEKMFLTSYNGNHQLKLSRWQSLQRRMSKPKIYSIFFQMLWKKRFFNLKCENDLNAPFNSSNRMFNGPIRPKKNICAALHNIFRW